MRPSLPTKTINGVLHKKCGNCEKFKPRNIKNFAIHYIKGKQYYSTNCKICRNKINANKNNPIVARAKYMQKISKNWPENLKIFVKNSKDPGKFHGVLNWDKVKL